MLVVTVDLTLGTIRAGSADDLALTGRPDPGEWPPSPARLFGALVAADGTRERCRVSTGEELVALETADPPRILADPPDLVEVSPLCERFVVIDAKAKGHTVQNYPLRSSAEVRPGSRLSPHSPRLFYVWDTLEVSPAGIAGLRARAARVSYLGCADSPVRVTIGTDLPDPSTWSGEWIPDERGTEGFSLPVPHRGFLDGLDSAYDRFTAGELMRRSWIPTARAWYRPPGARHPAAQSPPPHIVWLRFDTALAGRLALRVSDTLRAAILDLYERHVAHSSDEVPQVLHGHGFQESGYQHAHWLVLPDVGHRHATGRLHGAAIWLPAGTDAAVVEGVRTAAWHLRTLVLPGGRAVAVRPRGLERKPWATVPERWEGPARHWVSALPVVHERWRQKGPQLEDVARWCSNAGLPPSVRPTRFDSSRLPLIEGGLSLGPSEVRRSGQESRPYSHVQLELSDAVRGPLILGRGRQFGLGLMCPITTLQQRGHDGE